MTENGTAPLGDDPFFILGCVRSGTTLLRDVLRSHPDLVAPEETHFFRWGDPYGHKMFRRYYFDIPSDVEGREPIYRLHRKIDGLDDGDFARLLESCRTRAELQTRYVELHRARRGLGGRRWFEKSPQNIYGILLLRASFPGGKFIHLVRNPLDVAASLKLGRVIRASSTVEACNYWLEAVQIFEQFQAAWPAQSLELKYERLVRAPAVAIGDICGFLDLDPGRLTFDFSHVREKAEGQRDLLGAEEIETIGAICGAQMERFGYGLPRLSRRIGRRPPPQFDDVSRQDLYDVDGAAPVREASFLAGLLRPGDLVIDAAAGAGSFVRAILPAVGGAGRIIAFEPQSALHWLLIRNAVTGSGGVVEARQQWLARDAGVVASAERKTIDGLDLDLGRLDLLRLGPDGTEVLAGANEAIARHRPFVAWSCRQAGAAWQAILALQPHGYRAWIVRLPEAMEGPLLVLVPDERLVGALDRLAMVDATAVAGPDDLVRAVRESLPEEARSSLVPPLAAMVRQFAEAYPALAKEARVLLDTCLGSSETVGGAPEPEARLSRKNGGSLSRRAGEAPSFAEDLCSLAEHYGLFDGAFYLKRHPEVAETGMDPFVHFLDLGWREQFDPSPEFDVAYYLETNPDVAASGANPLLHYVFHGQLEGRRPKREGGEAPSGSGLK